MTKNPLRRLKKEKKLLVQYANLSGIEASDWDDIAPQLVMSEDAVVERADGSTVYSVPEVCLQNDAPSSQSRRIALALLQPETRLVTDRAFFGRSFNAMMDSVGTGTPVVTKGVSYPSSLQRGKSDGVIEADGIWLLDLFSNGLEYCKQVGDPQAYRVVDTTIYEGWNRFCDQEISAILSDLPESNPGETIVVRFLETLIKPRYDFVRDNVRVRGNYLQAIAGVLGLSDVIRMRDVMRTEEFTAALSDVVERVDPFEAFSYEGGTEARDFTPFVYAEELALRRLYYTDACTGPIREDLPLNVDVLALYLKTGERPTPVFWYTRPTFLPPVRFDAEESGVADALATEKPYLTLFVAENVQRMRRGEYRGKTIDELRGIVIEPLAQFMRDVQDSYVSLSYK